MSYLSSKAEAWRSGGDFPHLLLSHALPRGLDGEGGNEGKCLRGFIFLVLPLEHYIMSLNA